MNITTQSDSDALYLARQWRQIINLQLEEQKVFAEEHKRYTEFYKACKNYRNTGDLHEGKQ